VSAETTELISRVQAGGGDAFRELTEPYRRELQVHCYRILGSFQDAEDALSVPIAWLHAWRSRGRRRIHRRGRTWAAPAGPLCCQTRCAVTAACTARTSRAFSGAAPPGKANRRRLYPYARPLRGSAKACEPAAPLCPNAPCPSTG
jgi:hypothetical protein